MSLNQETDLRLSNMQQTLTKVGCITLQMADFMLKDAKNFDDKSEINSQISMSYDSIALLGHLIGDLSNQRRLTMKNALKPEYQTLNLKIGISLVSLNQEISTRNSS